MSILEKIKSKFVAKPKEVRFYNASYEYKELMCFSRVYCFHPKKSVWVSDDHAEIIYNSGKDYGIFPIFKDMTNDEIKQAHKQALIDYYKGCLTTRERNYQANHDMLKSMGRQVFDDLLLKRTRRWKQEIEKVVEGLGGMEQEFTFIEGGEGDFIRDESLFNPQQLIDENPIVSSSDDELNDILETKDESVEKMKQAIGVAKRGRPKLSR